MTEPSNIPETELDQETRYPRRVYPFDARELTEEQIARYDAIRGYRPHHHRARRGGHGPKGH